MRREADMDEREFQTESSDFDVENFNLKVYLWECLYLTKPTVFKAIWFMFFFYTITFVSYGLLYYYRILRIKYSALGYFHMVEPAYMDIQLVRYKQRLYFKKLHSYD